MPQHKTRKQIRQDLANAQAELATLKSPEGLARYMISLKGDEAFEEAFQAEIEKIAREHGIGDIELTELESPEQLESPVPLSVYRVMYVKHAEKEGDEHQLLPLLIGGEEVISPVAFDEETLIDLAEESKIDRLHLQVEHRLMTGEEQAPLKESDEPEPLL